MLRVELEDISNPLTLRMQGRLVGDFAQQVRELLARREIPRNMVVDVSDVTFVDTVGEQVLVWLGRMGAKFVADSSYPRDVCERLHLLLA